MKKIYELIGKVVVYMSFVAICEMPFFIWLIK